MKSLKYNNTPKGWTARLIARIKYRAKTKGIECDIDTQWLRDKLSTMTCEVTGIQFNLDFWVAGATKPFSPSIDRKDPKQGYTKDNCQVVCWIYNAAKPEFTHNDVVRLAKSLV